MQQPEPLRADSVLRDQPRLGPDSTFVFECRKDLPCFTQCCRDVSIVLTPYDIIRLKRALKIDSTEFLQRYTISPFTAEQKFPVVLLRMEPESGACPFVAAEGCRVYDHRPWSCRMYPLGLAEPKTPAPGDSRFHFLVKEELCAGHGQGCGTSVRDWTRGQGIEEFEAHGGSFKDLTLHEFWDTAELKPAEVDMFYMACYDLDRFRRFVFESTFLTRFDVDEARVEAMRTDDSELLDFAMQWLRFALLKERTMKMKAPVPRNEDTGAERRGQPGR